MTGRYLHDDGGCSVNLSRPPITCVITTAEPLPSSAWRHVQSLAEAVEAAAALLTDDDPNDAHP